MKIMKKYPHIIPISFYLECPQNTFGVNCSETCSQNCGGSNNACDNVNGFCTFGCDHGYQGKRCQTRK